MSTKMITGVVQRVLVREKEGGADTFGNTHSRALQINDTWWNFSGGTKPVWNVKIGDGFKVLGAGSEVAFKATTTVSKTNGKEYTNCNGLMVINLVEGDNSPPVSKGGSQGGSSGGNTYQAKPRDNTGQSTGHAINGAMNFILGFGGDTSNEGITELAKKVHNVTEKVKAEYKKMEPSLSDYDNGAASGQSVLTACKLVGTEQDFEQGVYDLAIDLLSNVVPKVMAHVKGEVRQAPPAKITRAAPAKKAVTKAAPVVDESEEDSEDSDLPF